MHCFKRREQRITGSCILTLHIFDEEYQETTHTILLLQPSNSKSSRTFMDFDTVAGAMDGAPRALG